MPASSNLGLFRSGINLMLYIARYEYESLLCKILPKDWYLGIRGRLWVSKRPSALRNELRRDLHTLTLRMARRVAALPNRELIAGLPAMQQTETGRWILNIQTLDRIHDSEMFASKHPEATEFDLEMFQQGWLAGVQSDYHKHKLDAVEGRFE